MCNEKGVTYPLVLLIILIFCFLLTFQWQYYLSEKKIHHETKVILKQEYYTYATIKKIEELLKENELKLGIGQFLFHQGKADYSVESYSPSVYKVTIKIKLNSLEEAYGFGYYDKTTAKMIKWVEKN